MNWHTLIILTILSHSIATIFYRAVAREKKADKATFAVSTIQSLFVLLVVALILPFIGNIQIDKFIEYFWWFVLGGISAALANACIYKVFTHLEAGIANILSLLSVVFVVIFGGIILHEYLNFSQYIGSTLILLAVLYASSISRHPKIHKRHKSGWAIGLGFAFAAGILAGGTIVNQKFLLDHLSISTFLLFYFIFQTLFLFIFGMFFEKKKIVMYKFALSPKILRFNLANGSLRAVAALASVTAVVKSDNVVLMTMIENLRMVLVIVLAAIFLKEREQLAQKFLAVVIASSGLVIIFLN